MRNYVLIALLWIVAGCALKVDPIQVQGQVNHVITFDPVKLADFFTEACQKTATDPAQVQQCVTDGIAQFWNAVAASGRTP